jgi:hypothetical protein
MQFVIIFGPPAVGKMTVGYELARLTNFKLFHNHMTVELVLNFFPYGHPQFGTLVGEFRRRLFEEIAVSDLHGLIFTYVWALDDPADKAYIDSFTDIFHKRGSAVHYVELTANQEERLIRNTSPFRLSQKPSKGDIVQSQQFLIEADKHHKLNSQDDFFYSENYIKIDNTHLSPTETAVIIANQFHFTISNI